LTRGQTDEGTSWQTDEITSLFRR